MATAAKDSMQFLQTTMIEEVNTLKSIETKRRVTSCQTVAEVENEIDDMFDTSTKKVTQANEACKQHMKKNIPKNPKEREDYVKYILPQVKESVKQTTSFWKSMLNTVGNFFSAIFNAIVWPFKKVGEFVCWLGGKVKGIFNWIGSFF